MMLKKLLLGGTTVIVLVAIGFGLWLWPDFSARRTTLKTLNDPNVVLTRYTDPHTARALEADSYRVVLDSDNQGDGKTAAYAMKLNGVTYWVELTRRGSIFPRETLKKISPFDPHGGN
ncbi:hypothetical protein ACFQ3L_01810 [Lacticaseibacillus jixianensis]|uniref:YxeA family protein n=1 Tax=Lacticaseibacillus jixianensis TaxID=2486012 RepID=A0ABW4B7L4_9LACO|nr:hypothetical protein [Lacticaseibacillus jixianensis]